VALYPALAGFFFYISRRSIKKDLLEPSIEDVSRAGVLAKFPRIRDKNYKFRNHAPLLKYVQGSAFPLLKNMQWSKLIFFSLLNELEEGICHFLEHIDSSIVSQSNGAPQI
jgi:hypothetical protein